MIKLFKRLWKIQIPAWHLTRIGTSCTMLVVLYQFSRHSHFWMPQHVLHFIYQPKIYMHVQWHGFQRLWHVHTSIRNLILHLQSAEEITYGWFTLLPHIYDYVYIRFSRIVTSSFYLISSINFANNQQTQKYYLKPFFYGILVIYNFISETSTKNFSKFCWQ